MLGFCMRNGGAKLAAIIDVDDTLILILERIDSPVTLIRAASTCRKWRRIIADAGFLRRCRSLHGPPVAGDYYNCNRSGDATGSPSFVPSSSMIDACHFSLDILVDVRIFESWDRMDFNPSWKVRDSRGSLLLMECIPEPSLMTSCFFPDLIVCEPLTRRYRIIPRPPDSYFMRCRRTYLVDGDEDEAGGRIGMSNFRVLCTLLSRGGEVAHTTVFTVGDTETTWSEKVLDHIAFRLVNPNVKPFYLGRVLGSSYSYVHRDGMLIICDGSTGKFSSFLLPLDIQIYWDGRNWTQNSWPVDGGDGEPRIIRVTNHTLEVFGRVHGHWGLENKVVLSKVTCGLPGYQPSFFDKPLTIMKRGVGFVVMLPQKLKQQWPFSVDLKTMEVAPADLKNMEVAPAAEGRREKMAYPCDFPWPPVLQVCLDR